MKRSTIAGTALGVGITAAIVTGALAAQAHDAAIQADCAGASIHLSNYPNHSSLTGTVDGAPVEAIFNGSYSKSIQWDATKNHSYDITVISGDGDHRYDKHYSQEVTGCAPTETPTPTGSPLPSDEPSSTPKPTETPSSPNPSSTPSPVVTPKPPVTAHPAPTTSGSTSTSEESPSTVQTPKIEAPVPTAVKAPVPTAVKAPATFTG